MEVNLSPNRRKKVLPLEPLSSSTPFAGSSFAGEGSKTTGSALNRTFISSILNATTQNSFSRSYAFLFLCSFTLFQLRAQRDLLLAREREVMLQREVQRINDLHLANRTCFPARSKSHGCLNIYSVTVYLNRNFCLHDSYAFLVLMKTNEAVEATDLYLLMDSRAMRVSSINFSDQIRFENLPADFCVKLEVYALVSKFEGFLPNHLSNFAYKAKLLLSPRNANDSLVGTTDFVRCGCACILRDMVGIHKMYLDGAEYPLEGTIEVDSVFNISPHVVSVDYSGFLTMYEVIAGFGSWTRYWAVLRQGIVTFWRDPNDEAAGKVLLLCCKLCLRLSMCRILLLLCLFTVVLMLVFRILLSADCKELCEGWMQALNRTLRTTRF
ncbi:unnamed protein product [Enterobius vermicularis]|uniref:PH domain-containing protein n=1 Tax=Enterobius vermicularis TaxID=51028 RepID=A0A3P6IKZ6_ENTVE|nr:unnamed protein product [Enterobius vermicularis]